MSMRVLVALALVLTCGAGAAAEVTVNVSSLSGVSALGTVAWLVPASGVAPPARAAHAIIDQQNRRFAPLVSIVQTGTSVDFPNSDNIRHSVYSFSEAKPFTLKLYSGRQSPPVTFDKPGIVVLGCNIHDRMIAWVMVVDSPWIGRSDAKGELHILGVPPGTYRLQLWHPGLKGPSPTQPLAIGEENIAVAARLDIAELNSLLPMSDPNHVTEHAP